MFPIYFSMLSQRLLISAKQTASMAEDQTAICVISCTTELKLTGNVPWELSVLSELPLFPTRKPHSYLWLFNTTALGVKTKACGWSEKKRIFISLHTHTHTHERIRKRKEDVSQCERWFCFLSRFMGSNVKQVWEWGWLDGMEMGQRRCWPAWNTRSEWDRWRKGGQAE